MEFDNKVVLIVGASSGIGRCVATQLAAMGAIVVAVARREALLQALAEDIRRAGGLCTTITADALDEQRAVEIVAELAARYGRIDAVLLNAGGAPALDLREMSAADVKHYMRINYDVLVNYLMPVLAQMRRQGGGLVAHTNSLAGLIGVPLQGPYSAAKGALRLLIDTCRVEFHRHGIRFVSVYPGFVATAATRDDALETPLEVSEDHAARQIIRAMRRERCDHLFPFLMGALIRLALLLPKALTTRILRRDFEAQRPA